MYKQAITAQDSEKSKDIRRTNIVAARAVADVVRTSLGPKGMDKMVSIVFSSEFILFIIDPRLSRKGLQNAHRR